MDGTSHRARRSAIALALIAASTATTSLALPPTHLDRNYAAARRARTISESHLGARQAALVATRARLDAARRQYRSGLSDLEDRLVAAYVSPPPEPLIAALTGEPAEALARAEVVQAAAESDWRTLLRYRAAVRDLAHAEAEFEARKRAAASEARLAAVRETIAGRRLARHRAAARPVVATPETTSTPVPQTERGLPAQILAARSLPGDAPIDAATGQPLSFDLPAAATAPPSEVPLGESPPIARRTLFRVMAYRTSPRRTATGEAFDPRAATAASRTLAFGTQVRLDMGGRTVTVRINDRGPYVAGVDLALSAGAAQDLGLRNTSRIRAEVLAPS
jgi:rare lipoprotein A